MLALPLARPAPSTNPRGGSNLSRAMSEAPNTTDIAALVEAVVSADGPRILASVIRACGGDFELAEDAVQEALIAALDHWSREGAPPRPEAWLITTARRRAIDQLRREATLDRKREQLERLMAFDAAWPGNPDGEAPPVEDDRLRLIFTCCHPALAVDTQIALTLRTVAGLDVPEIARAFLVAPDAMAKRLTRARTKIRDAGIPYEVPAGEQLPGRLQSVLTVIYLIFNEGYASTSSESLVREGLCDEAIRLARILAELMPDEPEARGLLALLLLTDAHRAARVDAAGELLTLEEQDRSLWNPEKIAEGVRLIERTLRLARPGPFQVQAAIAAVHAEAAIADQTDWPQIAQLYDVLYRMQPTAIVALNRAAAIGMASGPEAGLALLDDLIRDGQLEDYYLLPAARGELLRRASCFPEAVDAYRSALQLCANPVERRYLQRRLGEVTRLSS